MTDQEKTIELLKAMAEKASEDREIQTEIAAKAHADMVNAYMRAGFTRKEAINVTTQLIISSLNMGKVK